MIILESPCWRSEQLVAGPLSPSCCQSRNFAVSSRINAVSFEAIVLTTKPRIHAIHCIDIKARLGVGGKDHIGLGKTGISAIRTNLVSGKQA
jgi:hypothetical protein